MWYESESDATMRRTQNRPIPAGRLERSSAFDFAMVTSFAAVFIMALAVNLLAAGLLLVAILFYVFVYTIWLKRRTPQNIVIGGAAGAFPPVIGWAAVTGHMAFEPWVLFAIIFMWTPPHFWALALFRSGDYEKAGIPMMPNVAGKDSTRRQMLIYSSLLVPLTLLPTLMGWQGMFYLTVASILGVMFLIHAARTWKYKDDESAKHMFRFSIVYLFLLLLAMMVDHSLSSLSL